MILPRLYPILDAAALMRHDCSLMAFAEAMRETGAGLLQYRNKEAGPQTVLRHAATLRKVFADTGCRLILNDRADLAALAGWDGVHVGQGDLSPEDARRVMGGVVSHPSQGREGWGARMSGGIVGVSTHTEEQVRVAEAGCADYVAVGPVFATGTKLDASPVVGLDFVRRARALTGKPLVAIGGITRANARSVIEAGADSVAVISGLFAEGESVEKVARDFLELLR
jgi:thiamine-phosphate pyrophosphorylase